MTIRISIRHAAVHSLRTLSTFAITAPQVDTTRETGSPSAAMSPIGILGSRDSQERKQMNNPTPTSTGQSVFQINAGASASEKDSSPATG